MTHEKEVCVMPEEYRSKGRVSDLNKRRKPVRYSIDIVQYWDGTLQIYVHDVARDERSRKAVADALRRAAANIDAGT